MHKKRRQGAMMWASSAMRAICDHRGQPLWAAAWTGWHAIVEMLAGLLLVLIVALVAGVIISRQSIAVFERPNNKTVTE